MPDGQPFPRPAPQPADASPLERLYDAVGEKLYRFFYRQVGSREEAEDLTSEVFLKAASLLDTSRDESAQRAWLREVARTALADYWRRFYRAPREFAEETFRPPRSLRDGPTEASRADQLPDLLARLPKNYRQVLELRFLQGCSVRETAAALGLSPGNVKVLQYRAIHRAAELGFAPEPGEGRESDEPGF
ncbi:MAG TPA: sigma-70 family RNA polymerase sigma factor [Chloroflexota bacterium]|nr:sigma-70 family RNA polymerase sigma factor [Chloroflexota bacterium]